MSGSGLRRLTAGPPLALLILLSACSPNTPVQVDQAGGASSLAPGEHPVDGTSPPVGSASGSRASASAPAGGAGGGPGGAGQPAVEGSGPESPQPTRRSDPVLSLPSLPIGGSATGDTQDAVQQCVQAAWLTQVVPPTGIRVVPTAVSFAPAGAFRVGGSACAATPPACLGGSFAFTAVLIGQGRAQCYIPVRATGKGEGGSSVTVILRARTTCPLAQEAACRTFVEQVGNSTSQDSISVPFPSETASPEPSPKASPEASSPPASSPAVASGSGS